MANAQNTNSAANKVESSTLEKIYFEKLESVVKSTGAKGYLIISDVDSSDSEESDDENTSEDCEPSQKKAKKELTEEQLSKLRHVIITENREKMMNQGEKFATCGQENDYCMMFNTTTGNRIIFEMPIKIRGAMKKKNFPLRFDALFGLTYALNRYDMWLEDNECHGEDGKSSLPNE